MPNAQGNPEGARKATEEREAYIQSEKLAREIGDEEWQQGNTKFACEAWEASNITAVELKQKADNLLEAEKLTRKLKEDLGFANRLPKGPKHHPGPIYYNQDCIEGQTNCLNCKTRYALVIDYCKEMEQLLGFNQGVARNMLNHVSAAAFYRAAAVNCLKINSRRRKQ